jgi:nicotinate-nucleotide pyrophosphorylase (carboxylating)
LALAEDGGRDRTAELVGAAGMPANASLICRSECVVAGTAYAGAVARLAGAGDVEWLASDGAHAAAGQVLGTISGDLACILRAERPLLNVLQRAIGIATTTRRYVDAVSGTRCRILHTRKTAPGLRGLDMRAVLAGGGEAHRAGLDRTVMIKDNHWQVLARRGVSLRDAARQARVGGAFMVEVEDELQVREACQAGATRLLVDNQPPDAFRALAELARQLAPGVELEATGGITLANVRDYALAGADFVSVGALTHSVRAADVSLEVGAG